MNQCIIHIQKSKDFKCKLLRAFSFDSNPDGMIIYDLRCPKSLSGLGLSAGLRDEMKKIKKGTKTQLSIEDGEGTYDVDFNVQYNQM